MNAQCQGKILLSEPVSSGMLGVAGGSIKPIPGLETYEKFLLSPIEEQERMLREKPRVIDELKFNLLLS